MTPVLSMTDRGMYNSINIDCLKNFQLNMPLLNLPLNQLYFSTSDLRFPSPQFFLELRNLHFFICVKVKNIIDCHFMSNLQLLVQAVPRVCTSSCQSIIYPVHLQDILLTLFHAGRGIYAPPTTFRQFSPEVLIRGGSNYTLNLSFAIT